MNREREDNATEGPGKDCARKRSGGPNQGVSISGPEGEKSGAVELSKTKRRQCGPKRNASVNWEEVKEFLGNEYIEPSSLYEEAPRPEDARFPVYHPLADFVEVHVNLRNYTLLFFRQCKGFGITSMSAKHDKITEDCISSRKRTLLENRELEALQDGQESFKSVRFTYYHKWKIMDREKISKSYQAELKKWLDRRCPIPSFKDVVNFSRGLFDTDINWTSFPAWKEQEKEKDLASKKLASMHVTLYKTQQALLEQYFQMKDAFGYAAPPGVERLSAKGPAHSIDATDARKESLLQKLHAQVLEDSKILEDQLPALTKVLGDEVRKVNAWLFENYPNPCYNRLNDFVFSEEEGVFIPDPPKELVSGTGKSQEEDEKFKSVISAYLVYRNETIRYWGKLYEHDSGPRKVDKAVLQEHLRKKNSAYSSYCKSAKHTTFRNMSRDHLKFWMEHHYPMPFFTHSIRGKRLPDSVKEKEKGGDSFDATDALSVGE